jgi:S1-C subfamily serine protease
MRRASLYSSSNRPRSAAKAGASSTSTPVAGTTPGNGASVAGAPSPTAVVAPPNRRTRIRLALARRERWLMLAAGALIALGIVYGNNVLHPAAKMLTQEDIDGAVMHTIETKTLPSQAARAYDAIRGSVVRVREFERAEGDAEDTESGVGTGVVIVDKGIILTNLHVVSTAKRVGVVFADGTESEATIIATQPENDLAVLQAKTIPDDLPAATLRSTRDLALGDEVVAVGFPFGIGPSVTSGVVSGLRREYRSPEGKRLLTNLIQFDAAANP